MRIVFLKILYPLLALSSFINPFYGVIYYTFISVIRPEQLTYGTSSISGIFAIAIVSLFVASLVKGESLLASLKTAFFKNYFGFIGALCISTLISPYTDFTESMGSIYYLSTILQVMVFCLCLYAVLLRLVDIEIQRYVKLTVAFFLFMALWGVDQNIRGNALVEGLFGTSIIDRCAITGVFVLYLPVSIYFINKKDRIQKLFGFICFLIFMLLIMLTQSRAGFLGVCVTAMAVFYFSRRKLLLVSISAILLLITIPFIPDEYVNRIGEIKSQDVQGDDLTDYSSASRLLLWKVGAMVFASNPILGVGNMNFSKGSVKQASIVATNINQGLFDYTFGVDGKKGLSHTHNTYLNILVEGGILSAIPYFLLYLSPLWYGFKLNRKYKGQNIERLDLINMLNCGILGFMVTAFFANLILIDYIYWNLTLSYFLSHSFEVHLNTLTIQESKALDEAVVLQN
ncbi:MAG: O-antigen ligase family protein [Desulfuromonadaceae bacterium]|nr:O-antigen ligase family protein [Desulfuromonadaceae bacterium]